MEDQRKSTLRRELFFKKIGQPERTCWRGLCFFLLPQSRKKNAPAIIGLNFMLNSATELT